MPANNIKFQSNPGLLIPKPDLLIQAAVEKQHQGAESHGTLVMGNLRTDVSRTKLIPFSLYHGAHPPIYNLRLSRQETLEPWLDYLNVNFLGIPLPMPYPAGIIKFGLPSLGGLLDLSLPTIGLPSIPFPNFNIPFPAFLQYIIDLINLLLNLHLPGPPQFLIDLSALLRELFEKIKKFLAGLNLNINIDWFVSLLFKLGLNIFGFLNDLLSIPFHLWALVVALPLPILRFGPLPNFLEPYVSQIRAALDKLLAAFTDLAGRLTNAFMVFLQMIARLGDQLLQIINGLLALLNINISFPFPGLDLGQLPPPGTPWPPFPSTGVVPLVSWPDWMKAPIIANVPLPLANPEAGPALALAGPGTFAYGSYPGFYYQSFFDIKVKAGVSPGTYVQELFLEGSPDPTGALPPKKVGRITVTANVLEPNLLFGFIPFGAIQYPVGSLPLMDREQQYAAAPQAFFESEHVLDTSTYITGTEVYPLPHVASKLTAVQVTGSEKNDVTRGSSGFEDNVELKGNGVRYLVRLYEVSPGEWWEEALIPDTAYTVDLVADTYNAMDFRIKHSVVVRWEEPVGIGTPAEWPYPLAVPSQPITPLVMLPVASAPIQPRNPAVQPGIKYRLYTASVVNVEGAVLTPTKDAVDVTAAIPSPEPGPIIFHYTVRDGKVMDKDP